MFAEIRSCFAEAAEVEDAVEAGIKYLVLAAASAAFLLFGMALIYADLGTWTSPAWRNCWPREVQ